MAIGLVGRKAGMTRVFTDAGVTVPVTVIEVLPNRITQVKDKAKDGYRSVQVTYGTRRPQLYSKALNGHYAAAKVAPGKALVTMGDCGAFNYINDDVPPYTPDEVIDFYDECGFDFGISIDHVIFGYDPAAGNGADHPQLEKWEARQQLTLDLA